MLQALDIQVDHLTYMSILLFIVSLAQVASQQKSQAFDCLLFSIIVINFIFIKELISGSIVGNLAVHRLIRGDLPLLFFCKLLKQLLHALSSHQASPFLLVAEGTGEVTVVLLDGLLFLRGSGLRRWWVVAVNILELVVRWLDLELPFRLELECFMQFLRVLVPTHGILLNLINCVEPETFLRLAILDSFRVVCDWL